MSRAAHTPVMVREVVECLAPRDGETHLDGTFGAGGYSRAILDAADCRVIALDRDPAAVAGGRAMVEEFDGRLILIEAPFSQMGRAAREAGAERVDGVALDLGVSSMQLDQAGRGFSFMHDGPLDMRMSSSGPSAADAVNELPEEELADIIYQFGEERRSRAVARAIVRAREQGPITRTGELAAIVERAVGRSGRIHPATRTFQALRIYVNGEIDELRAGLAGAEDLLAPEGRLVVVSFHSLEDREVKSFMGERAGRAAGASRHLPRAESDGPAPSFRLPRAGTLKPSKAEAESNPRARSARLRLAVRTDAAAWGAA
jgi:16S rRNA (cytosine1402-N4)-methyltransferase